MPKLKTNCSICSIEFEYRFREDRKRQYCSLKCIQENSDIKRKSKCNWCNKIYKRGHADLGKYCSMLCKGPGTRLNEEQKLIKIRTYYEKNVIRQNGCWGWKGAVSSNGYGSIGAGRLTKINAHRAAWTLYKGEIPDGFFVLHTCDNRLCSNYVEHLFLGTAKDNSRDMINKRRGNGQFNKGLIPHNRKLIDSQVVEIKKKLIGGKSQKSLAREFKVDKKTIFDISHNKIWKHIKIKQESGLR